MDEGRLAAIEDFYEAALDPEGAGRLGSAFRRATGVESNLVFLANHRTGALERLLDVSRNFDGRAQKDYAQHYHALNPWYRVATLHRPPYVACGQEMISDSDLLRSEFGNDWCARTDIFHMIGGVQPVSEDIVIACGIHRPRQSDPFDANSKRDYAKVLRHLGRAFRIAARLGMSAGTSVVSLQLLDRLETGVLLLSGEGRLLHANGIAERLLQKNRWLSCSRGLVRPIYPDEIARFQLATRSAVSRAGNAPETAGESFVVRDPIDGALLIQVLPFRPPQDLFGQSVALVMFHDPDVGDDIVPERLAEVFGLTPAESRLAARLFAVHSIRKAAESLGVSEATARTQIKSVFAKTGFRRQSELLSAIGLNPMFRRTRPDVPGTARPRAAR
jgi:DNA-binding CsgD family transcriptional regulator